MATGFKSSSAKQVLLCVSNCPIRALQYLIVTDKRNFYGRTHFTAEYILRGTQEFTVEYNILQRYTRVCSGIQILQRNTRVYSVTQHFAAEQKSLQWNTTFYSGTKLFTAEHILQRKNIVYSGTQHFYKTESAERKQQETLVSYRHEPS